MNSLRCRLVGLFALLAVSAPAMSAESPNLRVAATFSERSPAGTIIENWRKAIFKTANVRLDIFWSEGLRPESDYQNILQTGRAAIVIGRDVSMVGLGDLGLPFTFEDVQGQYVQSQTHFDRAKSNTYNGVRLLAYLPVDVDVMLAAVAVNGPGDLKGKKLVVAPSIGPSAARNLGKTAAAVNLVPYEQAPDVFAKARYGADTVIMWPLAEISALAPSAGSWPLKVVTTTNHRIETAWVGISAGVWAKLDAKTQSAVNSTLRSATVMAMTNNNKRIAGALETMKAKGYKVASPTDRAKLFAMYSPNASAGNGCTGDEFKRLVRNSCRCVAGKLKNEC